MTIYQTSVGWNKWETLSTLELKIEELAKNIIFQPPISIRLFILPNRRKIRKIIWKTQCGVVGSIIAQCVMLWIN
ncbi:hypothetical protein INT80_01795 [Gallibacterium anatis]|uniref:Uncharacterized protein n=1 Tax=Gallibacterium anatis TaxID=750 RepID=A0A930Y8B2_9PAST|nr:hypothetical protein [Gallibacterium anatis]